MRFSVPRGGVMRLDLDTPIHCVDGEFGELQDVVIDPSSRRLTHLVVRARDGERQARLVPVSGVRAEGRRNSISVAWTAAEIGELEPIEQSAFMRRGELPAGDPDWDVGIQDIYPLPESGSLGPEILGTGMTLDYDQHVAVSYHRVPRGEVEIRRQSPVTSSDGHHLGHVVGFVVDDQKGIAHLVFEHGHLWGKRQVAIPGSAIGRFQTDELTLSLSSEAVGALRPLPAHR